MYECALCNKGFVLQVDLEAHLKTHTAIIQKEHTITKNHNSNLILIPPSNSANSSNKKVDQIVYITPLNKSSTQSISQPSSSNCQKSDTLHSSEAPYVINIKAEEDI